MYVIILRIGQCIILSKYSCGYRTGRSSLEKSRICHAGMPPVSCENSPIRPMRPQYNHMRSLELLHIATPSLTLRGPQGVWHVSANTILKWCDPSVYCILFYYSIMFGIFACISQLQQTMSGFFPVHSWLWNWEMRNWCERMDLFRLILGYA